MAPPPSGDRTLSPRDLARSLGVGQSSVKRWIDAGRLPATVTHGGHRRIRLTDALRFLGESGRRALDPEALGLGSAPEDLLLDDEALSERIYSDLSTGRHGDVRRWILAALVARGLEPAPLFDGPVRMAMARIGHEWAEGNQGIYVEHRATQILLRTLDAVDELFVPPPDGRVALGGSIDGDPSLLPTRMVATVLAAEGHYPVNLGADVPPAAFLEAADQVRPELVWISVSYVRDSARQSAALEDLITELSARGIACLLGGREVRRLELGGHARVGQSLTELVELARPAAQS